MQKPKNSYRRRAEMLKPIAVSNAHATKGCIVDGGGYDSMAHSLINYRQK
jgi:hypothetical protein